MKVEVSSDLGHATFVRPWAVPMPAALFIRMAVQRAAGERDASVVPAWRSYGSRALTTTFCLRALGRCADVDATRQPGRWATPKAS